MKIKLPLIALVLSLFITGCATVDKHLPIAVNPSIDDMSIALRTMSLSGNDEYFVDVDSNYYSDDFNGSFDTTTPVVDIFAAAGFFTDNLGFTNAKLLSNNQAGAIQLALGVFEGAHYKANLKRLDRNIFAWIPKSEASTKEEAQDLFLSSVNYAMRQLEGNRAPEMRAEYMQTKSGRGIDFTTDEKMYLPGKGLFEQGTYKNTGFPKKAQVYIQEVRDAYRDPEGNIEESFFIKASFYMWNSEQETNEQRSISDCIKFSKLMPEWYYQFLFIDSVPTVLTNQSINLFVKPRKESTRQASSPSN